MLNWLLFSFIAVLGYNIQADEQYTFNSSIITRNVLNCVNSSNLNYTIHTNDALYQSFIKTKFSDYIRVSDNLLLAEYTFFKNIVLHTMELYNIDKNIFINLDNIMILSNDVPKHMLELNIDLLLLYLKRDDIIYTLTKFTAGLQGLHQYAYMLIKNDFPLDILQYNLNSLIKTMDIDFNFTYELDLTSKSYTERKINIYNDNYIGIYDKFFHPNFVFTSKCQHDHFNPFQKDNHYARLNEYYEFLSLQLDNKSY